jgi:hypothetical protein
MSMDNLLKAKKESKNISWDDLTKEEFKKYYEMLHNGKTRWEVSKEDSRFYNAVCSRGFNDYVFPTHKYSLDFELDKFAQEYAGTIIPVKELAKKYGIPDEKLSHINRYLKKAVNFGIISKKEYEDAVERRKFLNLAGKYFSPEMAEKLSDISSKGFDYIKENQKISVGEVVKNFLDHNKNGYKNKWVKTNKFFSKGYGYRTYKRMIGEKHFSSILSKNKMPEKIRNERKKLINHLVWFFKIIKPLRHLKGLAMGHLKGVKRRKTDSQV